MTEPLRPVFARRMAARAAHDAENRVHDDATLTRTMESMITVAAALTLIIEADQISP